MCALKSAIWFCHDSTFQLPVQGAHPCGAIHRYFLNNRTRTAARRLATSLVNHIVKILSSLFCQIFGLSVPNNSLESLQNLSILPVGEIFHEILLIPYIVNVITKLCKSCLSGGHGASAGCPGRKGSGAQLDLFPKDCEKFTILLCILREDGL